jgi:hypothetical protein
MDDLGEIGGRREIGSDGPLNLLIQRHKIRD